MTTQLKPCPFCGCDGYEVHLQKRYYPNEDYHRWEVMCENCGAEILEFITPERAIEAWNRDVAPVVHASWEWITEDIYRCTACNRKAHVEETMSEPAWPFCPNCGAKMDGGVSDGH